jgi:polysaccharide biosynthesis transport protein
MNQLEDTHAPQSQAPDVRTYLRPLWRWKWVILLVVAVATAGTYFLVSRQAKQYVASTSVLVTNPDPAASVESAQTAGPPSPPSSQSLEDLATLLTDQATTAAVYKDLHLPLGSAGSVSVVSIVSASGVQTSFIGVTATSGSPNLAARLANTYVSVFLASQKSADAAEATSDLNATRQALNGLANTAANAVERDLLLSQESQLRTQVLNPSAGATPINPAVAPSAPASPNPKRDAVLGGLIGLLLGIGIAFGLDLLDRRLIRVSSVESIYGSPVVAVLPHVHNPTPTLDGRAIVPPGFVEAIRSLRINIGMGSRGRPPRTLLVTSGVPGEGKSTVVRDLALVYAEAGESVLVIDADLRRPSMATLFGVQAESGLAQVLRREVPMGRAIVAVHRAGPRSASKNGRNGTEPPGDPRLRGSIDLLSYGERVPNPVGLLSSTEMKSVLSATAGRYDIVILDSAPLLSVADTVPLLEMADAVVLVARLRLSTRDSADQVTSLIGRVPGTRIAGIVTNDTRAGLFNDTYARYSYGYDHGVDSADTATTRSS